MKFNRITTPPRPGYTGSTVYRSECGRFEISRNYGRTTLPWQARTTDGAKAFRYVRRGREFFSAFHNDFYLEDAKEFCRMTAERNQPRTEKCLA